MSRRTTASQCRTNLAFIGDYLRKHGVLTDTLRVNIEEIERAIQTAADLACADFRTSPASQEQKKVLSRYGCATDVSKLEAHKVIDELEKNNWKRPMTRPQHDAAKADTHER
jgi:hypothetical protein